MRERERERESRKVMYFKKNEELWQKKFSHLLCEYSALFLPEGFGPLSWSCPHPHLSPFLTVLEGAPGR
jgi:hypothetical protein